MTKPRAEERHRALPDEPLTLTVPALIDPPAVTRRALRLCRALEPAHLGPDDGRPCARCITEARRALAARGVLELLHVPNEKPGRVLNSPGTTRKEP